MQKEHSKLALAKTDIELQNPVFVTFYNIQPVNIAGPHRPSNFVGKTPKLHWCTPICFNTQLQKIRLDTPAYNMAADISDSVFRRLNYWSIRIAGTCCTKWMVKLGTNALHVQYFSCNKVTTAAPWGLSSVDYRTVLVSATMTLRKMKVHSNMWGLRLRRHLNHMWQFLYAESKDRLGLLTAGDDELWRLTVVHTVTTDMMGPARVDICKRAIRIWTAKKYSGKARLIARQRNELFSLRSNL